MANFDTAVDYLLSIEGGYSNNPADPGGSTNFGITLAQYQKHYPGDTIADIQNLTRDVAIAFYKSSYWTANFEALVSQDLCNKVFATYVNVGGDGIRFLQRALASLFKMNIEVDGVLGSRTVQLANQASVPAQVSQLLQEYRAQQAKHYAEWYGAAPTERDELLLGLMRRAVEA